MRELLRHVTYVNSHDMVTYKTSADRRTELESIARWLHSPHRMPTTADITKKRLFQR